MSWNSRPRHLLSVAPLGLALLAGACPPAEPGPCAGPPTRTLVFVDQSASSVLDAATKRMFQDTLAALAQTALPCKGDAVHGFLVHANTRGKVSRVDVVNDVEPAALEGKPKLARAREANRFRRDSLALAQRAREQLPSLLTAAVHDRFKSHTDMLGTLEVISDQLAGAESGTAVRIYYLGDMHESMPAPRRDFDRRPPRSVAEAEQWADADSAVLSQMSISRARFENAKVRVLLGNTANKPGMPEIRRYWERIFQHAGFNGNAIRFN